MSSYFVSTGCTYENLKKRIHCPKRNLSKAKSSRQANYK